VSAVVKLDPAATPQHTSSVFAAAIAARNLEAAADCFAKDACLITPDATAVSGREQIRPILAQLIASGARIKVQGSSLILAGEVALGSERWLIRSRGTAGTVFEQASSPTLVLRYLEDAWKLAIAAPWGWRRGE
jgi:ketosteroid isomerase-like protein